MGKAPKIEVAQGWIDQVQVRAAPFSENTSAPQIVGQRLGVVFLFGFWLSDAKFYACADPQLAAAVHAL